MASRQNIVIVSYIGIDGACAAAMAQLRFPGAKIAISSAQRIGHTLADLPRQSRPPTEIHVCGLGAHGEWSEIIKHAGQLRKKGASLF